MVIVVIKIIRILLLSNFAMAELHHESFRLITSQRGGEKLTEGGYVYGKLRNVGEITHWLCVQRGLCRAILHTQGLGIVKRTNEHSHPPDEASVSCSEVKGIIKRKAKDSQDSSHYIVGECLQTISEVVLLSFPSWTA